MAMVTIDKRRSGGADHLQALVRGGPITADDVLRLRGAIYQDGGMSRDKAAALFKLNRDHGSRDPAWAEFYVEALTDFFYWREGSDSALTEDAERMLMEWIGPAEAIDDATELRLLLRLHLLRQPLHRHSLAGQGALHALQGVRQLAGGLLDLRPARFPRLGQGAEHPGERGHAVPVVGREVGAAVERLAVRRERHR